MANRSVSRESISSFGAAAPPPAELPRRRFLGMLGRAGMTTAFIAWGHGLSRGTAASQGHAGGAAGIGPDEALKRLLAGNGRYAAQKVRHPNQTPKRRAEVAAGQHPFAIVLGCADSRVPPEIVFDQGLGDLFVVRVAGNIADDVGIASIEYAVEHLGARLVLVLGHEKCGAVAAAVEAAEKPGDAPGHLGSLVQPIRPAVERAKDQRGDVLDNAVRANVRMVMDRLKTSEPILAGLVKAGRLRIVGGRYALRSGRVDLIA